MVFSSLIFVFFFLPAAIFLYYIAKEQYRNYILLGVSILFYTYGEPTFVFIMIGSIVANYILALCIDKQKQVAGRGFLILAVVVNLGILFVFKYIGFFAEVINLIFQTKIHVPSITLPIGISFFTFQALSYVADVYRGTAPVQKNFFHLALYISFFPQLVAGPIVRYSEFECQLTDHRCTIWGGGEGIRRFLLGFCKKVILANNLSMAADGIFGIAGVSVHTANPLLLWIGSICFSLQILYDFSGYSDMAVGLGKIFGFEFGENFNYPYISKSATEFWRRWHISLGQWFRDYVYIPIGGSHTSIPKAMRNLLVVWLLTGIWHGANFNFLVWGCGWFILLALEKYIIRPEKRASKRIRRLWQAVTLICINFGWVIFNADGLGHGIRYCIAMVGYYGTPFTVSTQVLYYCREYGAFIIAGVIFATPVLKKACVVIDQKKGAAYARSIVSPLGYGLCFLWAVSYLILGAHNPFIYFNF